MPQAVRWDLVADKDQDCVRSFAWYLASDLLQVKPFDGYTVRLQIRNAKDSVVLTLTEADGISMADGIVTITIAMDQLPAVGDDYVWGIRFEKDGAFEKPFFGNFKVRRLHVESANA